MVPFPWCMIPGASSGARSVVPGAWGMVPCPWCMIPGAWILVHAAMSLVRDPCTKGQESDRPQVRSERDGTGSFEVASPEAIRLRARLPGCRPSLPHCFGLVLGTELGECWLPASNASRLVEN
ncbi:hypothetical protein RIF29_15111 [Crotalaria pallida]|uniref:Uncharacterized protein n=1 Tax=Crotalaria pallida TaxID=3830 RepID=A0AAN9FF18_CROPI